MASWVQTSFKFEIFNPLKTPLELFLQLLELVSSVLEALMSLIKPFLIDLTNPFSAIINALIAALRAIINQIESSGFSLLVVNPDFSQSDFSAVLNSVGGGYQNFETKVISKFFDASDAFRPQYPPSSSVAMAVFYIEAAEPSQFFLQLEKLMRMFGKPISIGLPAPVDVKVNPVSQSGDVVGQFRSLFGEDLDQALSIEWRMPEAPSGQDSASITNQAVAFYNSFRFPNFIIERIGPFPQDAPPQLDQNGETLFTKIVSSTMGTQPDAVAKRYNISKVNTKAIITEGKGGPPLKYFPTMINVSGLDLVEGAISGSYAYVDKDPELQPGKNYYYRVRAYFGDYTEYKFKILDIKNDVADIKGVSVIKYDQNVAYADFSRITLGAASPVASGFVPRKPVSITSGSDFNPYFDMLDAIRVGLLLNFEMPPTFPPGRNVTLNTFSGIVGASDLGPTSVFVPGIENTEFRNQQRTGWGTLSMLGGQIGQLKAGFKTSTELENSYLFVSAARRLANTISENIYDKPKLLDMLTEKWKNGVGGLVSMFYARGSWDYTLANQPAKVHDRAWSFFGILGGITGVVDKKIDAYLSREESYKPSKELYDGPIPLSKSYSSKTWVTVQERQDLADFLRLAIGASGGAQSSYLVWQSVTVGELFPALLPFMFQFEQFLLALLKAVNSALQVIIEIIETLLQKVEALKQIVQTLINIIDILNISFSAAILGVSGQGSAESLVGLLTQAENKPAPSNSNYSGIVATAGGPGEGFVTAIKVILFLLTAGQVNL